LAARVGGGALVVRDRTLIAHRLYSFLPRSKPTTLSRELLAALYRRCPLCHGKVATCDTGAWILFVCLEDPAAHVIEPVSASLLYRLDEEPTEDLEE
jgi:hypothetical protein